MRDELGQEAETISHSGCPEGHGKGSDLIPRSVLFQTIHLLNALPTGKLEEDLDTLGI